MTMVNSGLQGLTACISDHNDLHERHKNKKVERGITLQVSSCCLLALHGKIVDKIMTCSVYQNIMPVDSNKLRKY